jgi:hypothetical protein
MTNTMYQSAITSDYLGLEKLFEESQRGQAYLKLGWVDINGPLESQTERSLLHLAAKNESLELIAWGLKYGADPNVKDLKGRKPSELTKSDKIKEMLKHAKSQAPIISASLAQATSTSSTSSGNHANHLGSGLTVKEAPVLKGILSKWTNYRDGYQPRYFVLEGGVLSYYHDIRDYPTSCRGSISTLSADAYFPDISHDPSRFDVTGIVVLLIE